MGGLFRYCLSLNVTAEWGRVSHCWPVMEQPSYYREHAEQARRIASRTEKGEVARYLRRLASDFDDIATDLENGAVEIRHPERMPQTK